MTRLGRRCLTAVAALALTFFSVSTSDACWWWHHGSYTAYRPVWGSSWGASWGWGVNYAPAYYGGYSGYGAGNCCPTSCSPCSSCGTGSSCTQCAGYSPSTNEPEPEANPTPSQSTTPVRPGVPADDFRGRPSPSDGGDATPFNWSRPVPPAEPGGVNPGSSDSVPPFPPASSIPPSANPPSSIPRSTPPADSTEAKPDPAVTAVQPLNLQAPRLTSLGATRSRSTLPAEQPATTRLVQR